MNLAVYADETTIYIDIDRESDVASQCAIFQSGVGSLFTCGQGKNIRFEPSKSQAMIVSNKRRPWSIEPVKVGGIDVEEVSEMRIFGTFYRVQTDVQVLHPELCKDSQAAVEYVEQSDTNSRPVWAGNASSSYDF